MTGREKLIEWALNVTVERLAEMTKFNLPFCPSMFGLKDTINCVEDAEDCGTCWKKAVKKQYKAGGESK